MSRFLNSECYTRENKVALLTGDFLLSANDDDDDDDDETIRQVKGIKDYILLNSLSNTSCLPYYTSRVLKLIL